MKGSMRPVSDPVFTVTWVRTLLQVSVHLLQGGLPIGSAQEAARHGPSMAKYRQAAERIREAMKTLDEGLEREAKER